MSQKHASWAQEARAVGLPSAAIGGVLGLSKKPRKGESDGIGGALGTAYGKAARGLIYGGRSTTKLTKAAPKSRPWRKRLTSGGEGDAVQEAAKRWKMKDTDIVKKAMYEAFVDELQKIATPLLAKKHDLRDHMTSEEKARIDQAQDRAAIYKTPYQETEAGYLTGPSQAVLPGALLGGAAGGIVGGMRGRTGAGLLGGAAAGALTTAGIRAYHDHKKRKASPFDPRKAVDERLRMASWLDRHPEAWSKE